MNFLKTTLLGGLFVLLPLILLWLGLSEIAGLLVTMATPIADLFPAGVFDKVTAPAVVAVILLVGASFILGLAAKSAMINRLGRKFEDGVLEKVPMYRMLKIVSSALIDTDKSDISAAMVSDGSGGGDPCYVMEKHQDGRATVLLPWSPASFAGSIKVVQQSDLEFLDCSIDEYSRSLSQMGIGVEECISANPEQTA